MSYVTQILSQIESGDSGAAEKLLPLVYDELRKLAAAKLSQEKPGQTLQATAIVHEAYLRLVDAEKAQRWDSRGHFFAAAAEAMRRILVEQARRKRREKHGGQYIRVELCDAAVGVNSASDELLMVDESLARLAVDHPQAAEIVKLRYFAGVSVDEAADLLKISRATAYRHWTYARAWIRSEVLEKEPPQPS